MGKSGVKVFNGKTYRFDSSFGFLKQAKARAAYLRRQGYLVRITEGSVKAEFSGARPTTFLLFRVWKGPKKKRRK